MSNDKSTYESNTPMHGVLAQFDSVGPLMDACAAVRDAGYKKWDAHTPFPVHGLDKAMGIRPTRLPWLILFSGLTGLSCALLMQWWMNAYDYQFHISGKPIFSLPANIPVCFELTVLFSAFAAFFGSLGLNRLPELFSPLFSSEHFRRATSDRFFIYVETRDPLFNLKQLTDLFDRHHTTLVETIHHDERTPMARLPKFFVSLTALATVLTLVPLALIARAREATSALPRIHPIPDDMDSQYKFKPQSENWLFADGRAMREPAEGTVAVEDHVDDSPFYTGKKPDGAYADTWPANVVLSDATMNRGRERFGIYCAPCHGLSGHGDGMVAHRAAGLNEGTWVAPTSLHDERVRKEPPGEIFNTITHGIRNMPAYGSQIDEADRWAIIMYVKALELSQNAPKSDVPAEVLPTLQ